MSSHFNMPEFDHKAFAKYLAENKLTPSSKLHSLNENIEEATPFKKDALDEENLEEMANFFTITQDQKDKIKPEIYDFYIITQDQQNQIDPKKYTGDQQLIAQALKNKIKAKQPFDKTTIKDIIGKDPSPKDFKEVIKNEKVYTPSKTKKLVAQVLKGDKIKVGQQFTKATIKDIINTDPLTDFKAVIDVEKVDSLGKTADVNPKEPKTPGVRGRKKGTTTTDKKEPSMSMTKDKVVGVRDIDGPRAADVTAAEKELGGAKGIERTIAIDKAGKNIIAKLKDQKDKLKDPKFRDAKRISFISYLTRSKNDFSISQEKKNQIDPEKYNGDQKLIAQTLKGDKIEVGKIFNKDTINKITGKNIPTEDFKAVLDAENISGGKIGIKKGSETYNNLLSVWDNTVEDLIS